MGQRVYVLSQTEYSNILGIFTNIRQCRKYISTLTNQENILLHEIRMNEPQKGKIDMTKLLTIKEADLKNMEKQQTVGSPVKVNEKDVTTLKQN
jgi:predicted MarR family transcription regulator